MFDDLFIKIAVFLPELCTAITVMGRTLMFLLTVILAALKLKKFLQMPAFSGIVRGADIKPLY